MLFLATGIGCDLTARRNLLGGHVIQTVHEVHISTIVKEQWLVVTSANTCGTKVETARCYHLISSDIKESNALLANDQQPFAIVQGLKAKGLADCFQIDDTRLSTVGNHQVTSTTESINFPHRGSEYIAEPISFIVQERCCLKLSSLQLVEEQLAKGTYREQTAIMR